MINYKINEGVNLYIEKTPKFKDVNIDVVFSKCLDGIDDVYYYGLCQFLEDSCMLYDTKQKVSNVLDELYGAKLNVKIEKRGQLLMLRFTSSVLNGKFVQKDLLQQQFKLLAAFILKPKFFDEAKGLHLFAETKQILALNIQAINDNPLSYASVKANQLFADMLAKHCIYSLEDVEKMTYDKLKEKYQEMIEKMNVDFLVIGDVDEKAILANLSANFNFEKRHGHKQLVYQNQKAEPARLQESKEVTQSTLVKLYTCNCVSTSKHYASMIIGNGIFGTLPTSYLFQEIREKRSLCYSIFADFKIYDGIIKVATSFDLENLALIEDLIAQQLQRIKDGDFPDELLETTKQMYINNYAQSEDSVASILWNMFRESIIHDDRSTAKIINDMQQVTKESIMAAFKDVELKVTYVLAQGGGNL
ncbi:MAG: insulinase family protein [Erysipelotrichaceae bacterium]|nr:insulinase family protein [Erysipelotrichaceae bacterium]MDY5252684.1 pitrilysin family protein [Erysipelotrichaceae bacterium]